MIKGHIYFFWHDCYEKKVPLFRSLVGLKHGQSRPVGFTLTVEGEEVRGIEWAKLNDWLRTVQAALSRGLHAKP